MELQNEHRDQSYKGQEYLGLYPYCINAPIKNSINQILWILENPSNYVQFDNWLKGQTPKAH